MLTFDNIAGGELAEKFKMALAQIGRNILDPNMDPKAARGMTISLKFKPTSSGIVGIEFDIKTKLAGFEKTETAFLVEQDIRSGRIEINEYGNNRPTITALDAVQEPQKRQDPVQGFDPDTGEIYESPRRGPIDLRASGQ